VPGSGLPITAEWAFGGVDGSGIDVVVVDSGVDHEHPDAIGPHEPGVALTWDRDTQEVRADAGVHEDLYGHGTACAAIIRRAAPNARIASVRVLGARLSGKGEVFAAGLRWAISRGARVVNLSLSTGKDEMFGLFHEVADEAAHAGVVLVCAMNNIFTPTFPSQFSSVISVAACEGDDPFRLLANPNPPADFGAPGIDLEVAWLERGHIVATGNSFAAPHVTGLVARLLSKHPHLTPYQVKAVLRAIAENIAENADA
jgi:subtilisin family serine protease